MKKSYRLPLFLIILLTSCKLPFRDKDLTSYKVYKPGDTLVFENDKSERDTFLITSKSIFYKGWDEGTGGWYDPQVAKVSYVPLSFNKYRFADETLDTIGGEILTIYNSPDSIRETIQFISFFLGEIHRSAQKISDNRLGHFGVIYKVPKFDMSTVRDSTGITYVYWSDSQGIVGYKLKNGDFWTLAPK